MSPRSTASNGNDAARPVFGVTLANACFYVLSGCSQPLLMTICRNAGLADSSCQLYMFFYYLGPASVMLTLCKNNKNNDDATITTNNNANWPSVKTIAKGVGTALFDICSQTMNYTGAGLAGPTLFAIIYSCVTVWTAVFSRLLLQRKMNVWQWIAVTAVFGGLALTATDSMQLGHDVVRGVVLVTMGSAMHGLFYVMSEAIMRPQQPGAEILTISQNCGLQGVVAAIVFLSWQLGYTLPRFDEKIWQPMQDVDTTLWQGLTILFVMSFANLIHAITFFHSLRHFPGGATSAGVMKGLQAVLVFVFTQVLYCGRVGGSEMCFSRTKFLSLITVVTGVSAYGFATQERARSGPNGDYESVKDAEPVELLAVDASP